MFYDYISISHWKLLVFVFILFHFLQLLVLHSGAWGLQAKERKVDKFIVVLHRKTNSHLHLHSHQAQLTCHYCIWVHQEQALPPEGQETDQEYTDLISDLIRIFIARIILYLHMNLFP